MKHEMPAKWIDHVRLVLVVIQNHDTGESSLFSLSFELFY